MFTNADCTLYLYGKTEGQESYVRRPVEGVYWEDVRQASFLKTGQKNAVTALVVIPVESLSGAIKFTQGKDLIVKGIVKDEIESTSPAAFSEAMAEFKKKHNFLMVVSIDERLYGSESVRHYELSCK